MFIIRYQVDDYVGDWCDTGTRGNVEPMTFHDKYYADRECSELNVQWNCEGYRFFVETTV